MQLHLKTQQISVKIPNNDSDHYSTLDAEKQKVVDKRFSSKDGYSEIVLSEHASPLKTSQDVSKMLNPDILPPKKFFLVYFPFIVFLSRHFIDNGMRLVHFRHVVLLNFITRVALFYFSVQIIACIIFDWQLKCVLIKNVCV
jgi:hypothetical protein